MTKTGEKTREVVGRERGVLVVVHGHDAQIIDPRVPTMPRATTWEKTAWKHGVTDEEDREASGGGAGGGGVAGLSWLSLKIRLGPGLVCFDLCIKDQVY